MDMAFVRAKQFQFFANFLKLLLDINTNEKIMVVRQNHNLLIHTTFEMIVGLCI